MSKPDIEHLLSSSWWPVNEPWGDGTVIKARQEDEGGFFVLDCETHYFDEEDGGITGDNARRLADHIATLHNRWLMDREAEARLAKEGRSCASRT